MHSYEPDWKFREDLDEFRGLVDGLKDVQDNPDVRKAESDFGNETFKQLNGQPNADSATADAIRQFILKR